MPNCDRVGEMMCDAEMKRFTDCEMPLGTVRWIGRAATTIAANIVTRLGVQHDDAMPQSDSQTPTSTWCAPAYERRAGT